MESKPKEDLRLKNTLEFVNKSKYVKKYDHFKILGGSYEGEKIENDKINFLGSLPSIEEIRGKERKKRKYMKKAKTDEEEDENNNL